MIRRIHVHYRLQAPKDKWETAERAHSVHADSCPVYRSIKAAIAVTTELQLTEG